MDPISGFPCDELDPVAREVLRALGSTANTVSQVRLSFHVHLHADISSFLTISWLVCVLGDPDSGQGCF